MPYCEFRRTVSISITIHGAIVALAALIALFLVIPRPLLQLQRVLFPLQAHLISPIRRDHNKRGWEKIQLQKDVHENLLRFLKDSRRKLIYYNDSHPEDFIIYGKTALLPLSHVQKAMLVQALLPPASKFCRCQLDSNARVHGIRIYKNGSRLVEHMDWPDSWVISVTINLQESNSPSDHWAFSLRHGILSERTLIRHAPGEAVIYEGSRLYHSRPTAFEGDEYSAVFVGFVPIGYPRETDALSTRLLIPLVRFVKTFLSAYW